jgi:acetyltransferase-like isoleucine patch superfamily enzyme/acyl carrier protein
VTVSLSVAHAVVGFVDRVRSRTALRSATRVGDGVRVFGWPRVVNEGELTIGARVALLSSPSPIEFVVARGARLVVEERALIESGASLRTGSSLHIGRGVRVGAGCIIGDEAAGDRATLIGDGAWLENGAVVASGTVVPPGAVVGASAPVGSVASSPVRREPPPPVDDGADRIPADIDRRLRAVLSRVVAATSSVEPATELTQVKGWDSLAALRALVAIEKEFSIILPITLFAERPSLASVTPVIAASVAKHAGPG